jgi:hypothetical protein
MDSGAAAQLEQLQLRDDAQQQQQQPAGPAPNGGAAASPAPTATARPPPHLRAFSERTPDGDAVLHYQLVDLGAQLYVWVGGGGGGLPSVPNLHFAIQQQQQQQQKRPAVAASPPAVAALLPDGAAGRGEAMSRRLAKRLGRPVLLSCAIPDAADPLLHALAERRLLQELKDMGLLSALEGGGAVAEAKVEAGGAAAASASAGS